jgi:hypothetical protein
MRTYASGVGKVTFPTNILFRLLWAAERPTTGGEKILGGLVALQTSCAAG